MLIILAPKACKESATRLSNELNVKRYNPYKEEYPYGEHVSIINYGCTNIRHHTRSKVFNTSSAVNRCVNKYETFLTLAKSKLSIPLFTRDKAAASLRVDDLIVCHTKKDGRKNEGIVYRDRSAGEDLVDAYLYTTYFDHKREYRVVVFKEKVVGIYSKVEDGDGSWDLVKLQLRGFDEIIRQCSEAAKALKIDYVGFDVVANTRNDFKILEANSGPILTDEAVEAFKKYFN